MPIKVLIVDDHQILLDGYKSLLEAEGFNVSGCAENVDEGFLLYKKLKPDISIVDISMPGKSGLSCIESIIAYDNMAKIIVCTMYDEVQLVIKAMHMGAKGFITKTSSLSVIADAIKTVYSGGCYLSEKHAHDIALLDIKDKKEKVKEHSHFKLDELSEKELHIFKMVAHGLNTKEIAEKISLSSKTVANYRSKILSKIGAKNSRELTVIAMKNGLIKSDI